MMIESTACDCSPDCCKVNDTTYHYHVEEDCVHPNGFIHKLVSRAYTGEQPDYSKKSDSFVCDFRK